MLGLPLPCEESDCADSLRTLILSRTVVGAVEIMVYHPITLSFNVAGRYLLALIFLSVYLRACDSIPIGNEKIPAEEIVSRPKVRIPQGTVQGVDMYSHHERKFFGFKGIPYAEPPVGNLRFDERMNTYC